VLSILQKLNIIADRLILIKLSKRIDRQCQYTSVCHSFGKNHIEEIWNAAYLPFWLSSFCSSRQILSIPKNNYTGSMEKKIHITQTQRQIKWVFHDSSKMWYRGIFERSIFTPTTLFKNHQKFTHFNTISDWYVFLSHRISIIFSGLLELVMGYKMMLNCRGKYTALKVCSVLYFSKTMKNSCKLTLITDFFRQFYQNQSVDSFVLLFEVHITFGFQSEVPTLLST
jgi:hypothetical protein